MAARNLLALFVVFAVACGDSGGGEAPRTTDQTGDGDSNGDGDTGGDGDGDTGAASDCAVRHCYSAQLYTCFQWNTDETAHESLCDDFGGTLGDGVCPSDDRVAGCKKPSPFGGNGCAINWGYAPGISEEYAREDCKETQGEFIR